MRARGDSRRMWVTETRDAVGRALVREGVPMSAAALYGNLDIDTWTSLGPLTRTEREVSAALTHLVRKGLAAPVPEELRTEWDPRGKLYEPTPAGIERFTKGEERR